MRQQARCYSCSKENSKHPHIQATEKAGNEITNRHRNNSFGRHLSIALQPNKIHLHSNGWEAFEFLSVFHNFQRCKIAPNNLVQLPLSIYSTQFTAVPWKTSSLAVIIVHSDYDLDLFDKTGNVSERIKIKSVLIYSVFSSNFPSWFPCKLVQ